MSTRRYQEIVHNDIHSIANKSGKADEQNIVRVRVILKIAGLVKSFWVEAIKITYFVTNRLPSTAIDLKMPMEMY